VTNDQLTGLERGSELPRWLHMALSLNSKPLQDHRGVENDVGQRASRAALIAIVDSSAGLPARR